jgi:quinol monooxygenase YgiN
MLAGLLMGFSMAMPYRVVDPSAASSDAEVIVVITEVRLGGDRSARSRFWSHVRQIERALPNQPGLVGYALRREIFGMTAWTMTVWANNGAIADFMRSAVHRKAVEDGLPAVMLSSFVRFRRPAKAGPPGWTEAIEHLRTSGRSY